MDMVDGHSVATLPMAFLSMAKRTKGSLGAVADIQAMGGFAVMLASWRKHRHHYHALYGPSYDLLRGFALREWWQGFSTNRIEKIAFQGVERMPPRFLVSSNRLGGACYG